MRKNVIFYFVITTFLFCSTLFSKEATTPVVILLNTLPKSGSVFIARTLSEGLRMPLIGISNHTFPRDDIIVPKLRRVCRHGGIIQEHLDPSPHNIEMLNHYGIRLIVHIRDPRQALLSWTHHLQRLWQERAYPVLRRGDPVPPNDFFCYPLSKKLDWAIDHYFASFVNWITSWLSIYEEELLPIKITTYEEFHDDPDGFFEDILGFYGVPIGAFSPPSLPKTMEYHFRKGTKDEWKKVFTKDQKEKMLEMIPEKFFEEFLWER